MRKRLIGKAFAVAMTGAMAFTASPVTANIFNVAHIVKAANADLKSDDYVYCYAGLTWSEYWANEGVYNAGKASSSDVRDSNGEFDKGGYDAVTRATANHGLHRGNFQCTTVIHTKEGKTFNMGYWKDQKTLVLTDGSEVTCAQGKITDADGNTYTMVTDKTTGEIGYQILGLKYVPVAVKASDYEAFKAKYSVVENGGALAGGYGEGTLSSYTATANVTADTNGLKTATKNADGSFSFSARKTGSGSGLKDADIKKVDTNNIVVTVKPGTGSYGEFLRVDLTGTAYSDLGAHMQSVTWTYYGYDDTYSKPLATYGTKFAADNWMHKSMGIQLGLTDSDRCQLPEGYDGTGYWTVKVSALGYEDFSFNIQATGDNLANASEATDAEKAGLQKLIDQANDMKSNKASYCDGQDKAWTDLDTELGEAVDALKAEVIYSGSIKECTSHLTAAMNALTKKAYKTIITPATTAKPGSIVEKCSNCDDVKSTTTIAKIASIALSKTAYTENGKALKPSVIVKDSAKKTIASSNYSVTYSNAKSTNPGTYKVSVKFNGKNYAGTKTLSYKINAVTPAKTTVKLSSAKKTSLKVSWKKVAKATSYEVQYATSKNFKGAKTVKVSASSSSKTLSKLTKNKKYYVRVRAVRTLKVDNKNTTLRASWSSAKSLNTKKK